MNDLGEEEEHTQAKNDNLNDWFVILYYYFKNQLKSNFHEIFSVFYIIKK